MMSVNLILNLPDTRSASEILKSIMGSIKEQRYSSWQCEETIQGKPFIYYNPYRYYRDCNVVFTPHIRDNAIIFTPHSYPGTSNIYPTEINNHILHLCAILMKDLLKEGCSIEIRT